MEKKIIFVRWVDEDCIEDEKSFDQKNFELMISYIVGLYKLSFAQLPYEFGLHRELTQNALKIFYNKSDTKNKRAEMLFNEWKLRFSSIYGNAFKKDKTKRPNILLHNEGLQSTFITTFTISF